MIIKFVAGKLRLHSLLLRKWKRIQTLNLISLKTICTKLFFLWQKSESSGFLATTTNQTNLHEKVPNILWNHFNRMVSLLKSALRSAHPIFVCLFFYFAFVSHLLFNPAAKTVNEENMSLGIRIKFYLH